MNIKILVKKINGEKQETITGSEKKIDINYKRTFNFEFLSWAK